MDSMDGTVTLVTGAGSGLGQATARAFAGASGAVACLDIDGQAAECTRASLPKAGQCHLALACDVSDADQVTHTVQSVRDRLGRIDVAVNCAAIDHTYWLEELTIEQFDRVIAINLRGVFLGMKYALPHMIKAGGGSIINQASIAGLVGVRGGAGYCAAKAGVIALTRVAALEYGRYNIRVNSICPGAIETPMAQRIRQGQPPNPKAIQRISVLNRMAEPEEIAKVALFLASDDASFATGAPFVIDGGWTVS